MKVANVRLLQEPLKSFIFYRESNPYTKWHHHPEYELCLITKGRGRRMVGDYIDRFEKGDLVFIGAFTPHGCSFNPEYYDKTDGAHFEEITIHFVYEFLGDKFFGLPENSSLNRFVTESARGYGFHGKAKKRITSLMLKMQDMNDQERLYSLLDIFRIFAGTNEYDILSSASFSEPCWHDDPSSMQKASRYIMDNFQNQINIGDLLQLTNMSNTGFYETFKKTYRMAFKDYLLNIRVGYACRLLTEDNQHISEIAYQSGFGNISNFNRQFKKIKGITPSRFQELIRNIEMKK